MPDVKAFRVVYMCVRIFMYMHACVRVKRYMLVILMACVKNPSRFQTSGAKLYTFTQFLYPCIQKFTCKCVHVSFTEVANFPDGP